MAKTKAKKGATGFSEEAARPPLPPPRKPMAQRAFEATHPPRRAVNLTASSYWLHEAKKLGLSLSAVFDEAVEKAVRDILRERLKQEMVEYGEWHEKHIAEHGLWSDGLRRF